MGLKTNLSNLIPFYSITPELDIVCIQMDTLNMTLNFTTSGIFRISDETISPKSIEQKK